MDGLKHKAIVSLFSSYASQFATTGASLATKLILARLIVPEDLGLYAMALLILLGGDMLIDMGVSQHIVREKDRPYGNFLMLRLLISFILFAALELAAPMLKFWGEEFPPVMRLMAVTLVIKAASGVPNVFLDRELLIHRTLAPQIARISTMGLISIVLAYFDFGIWALAWGTVAAESIFAVLIWLAARGKLALELIWTHTWSLVWDSKFLFLIGLTGFVLQQGGTAVVGALLTPRDIGFYSMAYTLIVLVSKVVESAVFRVIYPMFCEYNQDPENLGKSYRYATLAIIAVEAPIYFFLLFASPTVMPLLLGKKWLPAALLMQALSVSGIINPFCTFGNEVLRATKRDRILTLSSVIGAVVLLAAGYILTLRYGVLGMVAAHYIMIGSIPTIFAVYRTVRSDFIILAKQLGIVYVTSFVAIAAASIGLSATPGLQVVVAGLLVPICWYTYYKAFDNGLGRDVLNTLRATAVTEAAG